MNTIEALVRDIRIALVKHKTVTINHPHPKRLWRVLKKMLPVCDIAFDERTVYVSWKVVP